MEVQLFLLGGLLVIVAIVFCVLYSNIAYKNYRLSKDNAELIKSSEQLQSQNESLIAEGKRVVEKAKEIYERNTALVAENKRLEPYKSISNVEENAKLITQLAENRAKEKIQLARDKANATIQEADVIIDKAKQEANGTLSMARSDAAIIRSQAEEEAKNIIEQAHKQNETLNYQIAELTKTAGAIRNKIEGYGTEYMIPGIGLLDNLAMDFGHTEAGQKLKQIRKDVKDMFKSGDAALCDYVETNRKQVAISFVADAFNGKVEEILSRVKYNNYGQLAQEIEDAAILVNANGLAFRNARISPQYVTVRLEELKWATIVHELKMKEREEQRAMQEQIREEAKVQKEIERAKREAAKEAAEAAKSEAAAQKAYNELKARFDAMSEKEKALHAQELAEQEAKLAEAEERIRLAEEKGQKALSMAQQTKQGHVYVISNIGSFGENVYKIGMTRRLDPTERVRELGDASVPFPFDIHGMIHFNDAPAAESQLHRLFIMGQVNKTNVRKEFFCADLKEIKTAVEKLGGFAHWTMLAEAAQYRETQSIEERIKNDPTYRQQWSDRQLRLSDLSGAVLGEEE